MSDSLPTKTCAMCCMAIPAAARKCGHCQHLQSARGFIQLAAISLLCIAPLLVVSYGVIRILDAGEPYEVFHDQITILSSDIQFGEKQSGGTVTVIGSVTNGSPVPWKQVIFHAEFFDQEGKTIDVGQKEEYSFFLAPHAASSFKISFPREFSASKYVSHRVRVITARDSRARF